MQIPAVKKFNAIYSEWRLVIDALVAYKEKLDREVELIEDEDKQNQVYDELERLEHPIPDFKAQVSENFE